MAGTMTESIHVRQALVAGEIVGPREIVIADGRIAAIRPCEGDTLDGIAVPGFVDTHLHGGGGGDFASADPYSVFRALQFHGRHGTTTSFASLVTASPAAFAEQVGVLAEFVKRGDLAGIHLEGPCLAHNRKGAHEASLLTDPTAELVGQLLDAGPIAMVTLAPELDGAGDAIRRFIEAGTRVAFGHCDADQADARASVDAGVRVATHLFNAMTGIHHREPGPIPYLLTEPRVVVELICDGVHVHPDVLRMAIAAAGPERVALITDAIAATGVADGRTHLGNLEVEVVDGTARLVDGGALAGSTLTMDRAFAYCVQKLGCTIAEASQMASTTPARVHGLTEVGEVAVGKWADINVVTESGALVSVWRRGRKLV